MSRGAGRGRSVLRPVLVAVGVVVVTALVAGLAVALGGDRGAAERAMVGSAAPSLRGTTLDGSRYVLHPARGHVTVVNIWAAWCAPCRSEIPLVAHAAADYRSRGVRVVTIDTRDGPTAARALLSDAHARRLLAVEDPDGRLAISWGATGVPETVVVDGRGIVRARWLGAVSQGWLNTQVRRWS